MFESPVRYFDSFIAIHNIHMYDFHDDAGHHHGSQYKQITAYKRQAPSQAGALWALFGTLDILALSLGKLYSFGRWAKFS